MLDDFRNRAGLVKKFLNGNKAHLTAPKWEIMVHLFPQVANARGVERGDVNLS